MEMNKPRNSCALYMASKGIKDPECIPRSQFDALVEKDDFRDGPFVDGFGDGYGEPYNPDRQAYGVLTNGRGVFCELREKKKDQS